jgi:DnaJ family protein C protein 9
MGILLLEYMFSCTFLRACTQVKYRGSAEERADLLQLFNRFRGDMRSVFDWLMLSRPELDSHRFRDTLEEAVAAGEQRHHPS